jgi:aminoglycoside phosphotransferase (APT) family kinase protein
MAAPTHASGIACTERLHRRGMSFEDDVARYFAARLTDAHDVQVTRLYRIPGGASRETWSVDLRWREGASGERTQGFIIRRDPEASLVDSDRRVEFDFYRSFIDSSVPVPRPLFLETDSTWLERPFFVMQRIDGYESQFSALLDPSFVPHRAGLARRMYEILADIAVTPIDTLPAVASTDVPAPDTCWRRELDYWEDIIDAQESEPQPIARAGLRWLRRHPPPPAQRVSVVHGDYRTGNFLYRGEHIAAILDWEMAHFGDPLEDLAWSFMPAWQWARDGLAGGIVAPAEAVRMWEQRSGLRVDAGALRWWQTFSCVKAQGIWLTGARQFADGRAQDIMLAFTSYWLINAQDRFLLQALGRL